MTRVERAARRLTLRRGARRGRGREPRSPAVVELPKCSTVGISWDGVRPWLPAGAVRRAARAALAEGRRPAIALSIVFVTDRALARLHARHLGDATRTDVITFDLSDDLGGPSGEIYVSAERARRSARQRRVDPRRELSLYVVHGALHLCGFDDKRRADRARMRAAEARVLARLGHANDPAPHDA